MVPGNKKMFPIIHGIILANGKDYNLLFCAIIYRSSSGSYVELWHKISILCKHDWSGILLVMYPNYIGRLIETLARRKKISLNNRNYDDDRWWSRITSSGPLIVFHSTSNPVMPSKRNNIRSVQWKLAILLW